MKKFLGLSLAVAAAVAAFGAGTGSAAGTCAGPLSLSFTKNASAVPSDIATGSTPFGSGTVTVSGVTSAASTSATLVLTDGSGNTFTLALTGTTSGSTHLVFTATGGTISGTGACAGATGSVTGGAFHGENSNTKWVSDTAISGSFRIATAGGAAAPAVVPRGPDRYGYCLNGVFLNLLLGQPGYDPLYKGATPAFYIDGVGLTCDPPSGVFSLAVDLVGPDGLPAPPGYTFPSVIYPHYVHK